MFSENLIGNTTQCTLIEYYFCLVTLSDLFCTEGMKQRPLLYRDARDHSCIEVHETTLVSRCTIYACSSIFTLVISRVFSNLKKKSVWQMINQCQKMLDFHGLRTYYLS